MIQRDKKGRFLSKKDIEILALKQQAESAKYREDNLKRDLDETRDKVRAFLDQIDAIKLRGEWQSYGSSGERYRLVLDINERMVHEAFQWGNDSYIIDMLGQQLGRQASREIALMNMKRYERR